MMFQMDLTDFVLLIAFLVGSGLTGIVMRLYHHGHKVGFMEVGVGGLIGGVFFAAIVYGLWLSSSMVIHLIQSRRERKQGKGPDNINS